VIPDEPEEPLTIDHSAGADLAKNRRLASDHKPPMQSMTAKARQEDADEENASGDGFDSP